MVLTKTPHWVQWHTKERGLTSLGILSEKWGVGVLEKAPQSLGSASKRSLPNIWLRKPIGLLSKGLKMLWAGIPLLKESCAILLNPRTSKTNKQTNKQQFEKCLDHIWWKFICQSKSTWWRAREWLKVSPEMEVLVDAILHTPSTQLAQVDELRGSTLLGPL